jgi:hypothetical protein
MNPHPDSYVFHGFLAGALFGTVALFTIAALLAAKPHPLWWRRRHRVILFSASTSGPPEIVFAYARRIDGVWFANWSGGQFSESTAVILNADGTTTGHWRGETWRRLAGMDGFGPAHENAQTPDTPHTPN